MIQKMLCVLLACVAVSQGRTEPDMIVAPDGSGDTGRGAEMDDRADWAGLRE